MTPQTIFDHCAIHLSRQAARSVWGNGCAYRGQQGRTCSVGHFMPDSAYERKMEGRGVADLLDQTKFPKLRVEFPDLGQNEKLFRALQTAHDHAQVTDDPDAPPFMTDPIWVRLAKVAARFELDGGILTTLDWPTVWT